MIKTHTIVKGKRQRGEPAATLDAAMDRAERILSIVLDVEAVEIIRHRRLGRSQSLELMERITRD
ncbi:hypothetical protein GURKE_00470 [Brevundimonas phage vB_BpoS-Gurke]|uniref:Uncharacterized protein n=1 Tax=Brevundimonas phage vB_BpoS-Gurke TaxID=2948599 RepID=A0A9E7N480_9CAUD|nr:hypothetical protein GURKE_00470 [Brevundimonas phage vB_BpoS-Gurke]